MRRKSILLIDDEPDLGQVLAIALERAGYDTAVACDGTEGINLFLSRPFDAVISDIIMPEREGFDTIREIRRHAANVVIIAISGCGRVNPLAFRDIAQRMGADTFLAKPFKPSDLIALTRATIDARHAAAAAAE